MGGSISAAAKNLGVVYQSVYKWSDPLPNWLRWQIKGYLLEKKQSKKLKDCEFKTCIGDCGN